LGRGQGASSGRGGAQARRAFGKLADIAEGLTKHFGALATVASEVLARKGFPAERVALLEGLRYEGHRAGERLNAELALSSARSTDACARSPRSPGSTSTRRPSGSAKPSSISWTSR